MNINYDYLFIIKIILITYLSIDILFTSSTNTRPSRNKDIRDKDRRIPYNCLSCLAGLL